MPVVLAVDGSPDAAAAGRAAADITRDLGWALHVTHVWTEPRVLRERLAGLYREAAAAILDEHIRRIREAGTEVAGVHLRSGHPADEVLEVARSVGAGLLIAGSRGLGGLARVAMGSVSEALVHHATCPVLVVRGGQEAWPPRRVVAGDDGSATARSAAVLAVRIAARCGAAPMLVRAVTPTAVSEAEAALDTIDEGAAAVEHGSLEDLAGDLEEATGLRPTVRVAVGDAAEALVHAVDEVGGAALVAVGSRGLGMLGRMRFGSVSTRVLRGVSCSVLVVPPPAG